MRRSNPLARKAVRDGSLAGATHILGRNGAWIEEDPDWAEEIARRRLNHFSL